jgi:acyl-CoA hydrolase
MEKSLEATMRLIGVHPVKHSDLGFNNTLFGGTLLSWVDSDCVAYAMEVCDNPRMVTVSIDKCVFQRAAGPSHIIKIYAQIEKFGNTSVTLKVEARRHNVYDGKQQIVLATDIKFVRVDEEGNPIPISDRVKKRYAHIISSAELQNSKN